VYLTVGIAGQHQLHGYTSADERNHGELFESDAVFDGRFARCPVPAADGAKQLFDMPAQPIPTDHLQCLRNALHPMVVSKHQHIASPRQAD